MISACICSSGYPTIYSSGLVAMIAVSVGFVKWHLSTSASNVTVNSCTSRNEAIQVALFLMYSGTSE